MSTNKKKVLPMLFQRTNVFNTQIHKTIYSSFAHAAKAGMTLHFPKSENNEMTYQIPTLWTTVQNWENNKLNYVCWLRIFLKFY
jgi:hypothetical protein